MLRVETPLAPRALTKKGAQRAPIGFEPFGADEVDFHLRTRHATEETNLRCEEGTAVHDSIVQPPWMARCTVTVQRGHTRRGARQLNDRRPQDGLLIFKSMLKLCNELRQIVFALR